MKVNDKVIVGCDGVHAHFRAQDFVAQAFQPRRRQLVVHIVAFIGVNLTVDPVSIGCLVVLLCHNFERLHAIAWRGKCRKEILHLVADPDQIWEIFRVKRFNVFRFEPVDHLTIHTKASATLRWQQVRDPGARAQN